MADALTGTFLQPLPARPAAFVRALLRDARNARLQRSLALIAGLSGGLSGLEVGYMHYRASYGHKFMWTPVLMSQVLLAAGVWSARHPRHARRLLPVVSALTLADCVTGFYFHLRGVARRPGGWRLPIPNVPMGPPPFAPLLFGMSAYMGIVAARMQPESALGAPAAAPTPAEAQLQKHLALVTAATALMNSVEALYSHYKNGFHFRAQYTPVLMGPLLATAAIASASNPHRARRLLPIAAGLSMLDGAAGGFYHARGVVRRPGGRKNLLHNIMYGPPLLAPLLFAASGLLGILAGVMSGSRRDALAAARSQA